MPNELSPADLIVPEWGADARVGALMTTRLGGVSAAPWDSLNLGRSSGDAADAVAANRARVAQASGATHVYMSQVHGDHVLQLDAGSAQGAYTADAAWTQQPGLACTVMVADCLPVLLAAPAARAVGAAHAGWRGLARGVVERTIDAVCRAASCAPRDLVAWLGPCIGPDAFEVGADVLEAFGTEPKPVGSARFRYQPRADGQARWRADLAGLARDRLAAAGVSRVSGGIWCTVADRSRFFSFRRDGVTGRMAACVWIRP
ncbi:MAG TPA: peptidoglycan editing factor PgeF [Burkholderiaceae bacterium]|nr:peptidoglycan editing factor PgeF [Burkholderiaceae bacterium]